jgi:hypothetical protein
MRSSRCPTRDDCLTDPSARAAPAGESPRPGPSKSLIYEIEDILARGGSAPLEGVHAAVDRLFDLVHLRVFFGHEGDAENPKLAALALESSTRRAHALFRQRSFRPRLARFAASGSLAALTARRLVVPATLAFHYRCSLPGLAGFAVRRWRAMPSLALERAPEELSLRAAAQR